MTLGSESVLKHRVGVSGTESNTATFCLDSHVIEEVWRLSGFDRSSRRLSVVMCVQSGTHTHTHTHTSEDITLTYIHFLETYPNLNHNHRVSNPNLKITLN